jgi:hypothetical protein
MTGILIKGETDRDHVETKVEARVLLLQPWRARKASHS